MTTPQYSSRAELAAADLSSQCAVGPISMRNSTDLDGLMRLKQPNPPAIQPNRLTRLTQPTKRNRMTARASESKPSDPQIQEGRSMCQCQNSYDTV